MQAMHIIIVHKSCSRLAQCLNHTNQSSTNQPGFRNWDTTTQALHRNKLFKQSLVPNVESIPNWNGCLKQHHIRQQDGHCFHAGTTSQRHPNQHIRTYQSHFLRLQDHMASQVTNSFTFFISYGQCGVGEASAEQVPRHISIRGSTSGSTISCDLLLAALCLICIKKTKKKPSQKHKVWLKRPRGFSWMKPMRTNMI